MALEELLAQTETRFKKAIDALKHDVATVRTGRAAPSLVEQLEVEAYGVPTPLIQLAQITDGAVIRLNIPALNEERRRDLVKVLHKKVEDGRVEIRTLRRHTHEEMRAKEKSSGVSTDDVKRLEAQLQKLTDRYILMADEIGTAKEKEILAV